MRRARTKAVISYQADVIARSQRQADLGTAERLRGWRDMVIAQATSQQGKGGCPLGSLAGQLAEADPHGRALLAGGFGPWQAALGEGLRRCARPNWSGLTAACASGCFVRGRPTSPAPVEPPPVSLELPDMPGRFTAGGWQQHGPGTMESR